MYYSLFARSIYKARSNSYKVDVEETQIREIKKDKEMSATLLYPGTTSESKMRCCKALQKAQASQSEIINRKLVLQDKIVP